MRIIKICILTIASFLFLFKLSFAADSGYADVIEIKSWPSKNDIYLAVAHECGGTDIKRYHLSKDDNQQYSLLMSAFVAGLQVNLRYDCQADGYPSITGVRAKKAISN